MPAIDAFLAVATQWRTEHAGDGHIVWTGLDYTACKAGFEFCGTTMTPGLWRAVQVIERAAMTALNAR